MTLEKGKNDRRWRGLEGDTYPRRSLSITPLGMKHIIEVQNQCIAVTDVKRKITGWKRWLRQTTRS